MSEPVVRPDPDALLRRVQEEEARAQAPKLKIFFGFAPGVGKTFRMLEVARALVEQGVDVVVGLVETHGRQETTERLEGLPLLPRRTLEYRGRTIEEFDLDAALARKPAVLVLDELAHTNAPGSRHPKRWQDVVELLDAGIDVFTTVNVQHVDSLNDVVAQITGVAVRETVPDSILDRADDIEVVDITPEALLQRLREGKVYLPEQAGRATEHFFQRGNLLALRELALRRTAQHVDEEVQEYRERHGVEVPWPAGERLMACVGPGPGSRRVIRAAARMAAALHAPWEAVYVEASALPMSDGDRDRLEAHLELVESLGGTHARLVGPSVVDALLTHARRANVTRILIGRPVHQRLRDRLRGSLVDAVVRRSEDLDVHVVSGDDDAVAPTPSAPIVAGTFDPAPYAWATAGVVATTVLSAGVRELFPVPDLEMLYLLTVMATAVRLGRGPSLWSAALGVAAYDFFFVPPVMTFVVADVRYVLTFGMMFGVGAVVGELAARIRRQEQDAVAREQRTATLYALSSDLAKADDASAVARVVADHAAVVFGCDVFVLRLDPSGALVPAAVAPAGAVLDAKELSVARWCLENERPAGAGTDTLPGAATSCVPLIAATGVAGVMALAPRVPTHRRTEQRAFLEAFARQAAFAFERMRLGDEARTHALRAKTEEMRSALLSAVSHDLRTPLGSITGAATSLRDTTNLPPETRVELVESICDEAERLERLVSNLLDMTRLESGALAVHREWVPVEELVGSALTRLEARLADRVVTVDVAPDVPLVPVDPVLFGQVFLNLVENATKYTPAGSPLDLTARRVGRTVVVEVADRGPGLPEGGEEQVFEKFVRGVHTGVAGVGLGLPICRGIVEAHGGGMTAGPRPGGGAVFRVTLPLVGEPPSVPREEPP